jgi:ribosomal protein S18 acetylase RimI-like enzyme
VEIRRIAPEEYEQAGRLVVAAYEALEGGPLDPGYAAELADIGTRAVEAEVLVALDGGELVGCVTFVPDPSSPWAEGVREDESAIRMLAVDPGAQGRGAGGALLDACIVRAVVLGRRGLFLHSTPWMGAAHRMYRKAGFVRVPDRDWLPVPEVPLLAFRLALTTAAPLGA